MSEGFTMAQFLITLFGMTGTVGAAIAAWQSADAAKKSLEEQSENNKRAIKPHIVIEEKKFELVFNKTNERCFDLNWDNLEHKLQDRYLTGGSFMDLVNISSGNARDIKVKTVIKGYKKFITQFNEHVGEITIDEVDHEYRDSQVIKLDVKQEGFTVFPSSSIDFQINNFLDEELLFIKSDGGRNSVRIPDAFLVLFNIFFSNYEEIQLPVDQWPYLFFVITFKDITGTEYDVKYKVKLKNLTIDRKYGSIGDIRNVKFSTSVEQI